MNCQRGRLFTLAFSPRSPVTFLSHTQSLVYFVSPPFPALVWPMDRTSALSITHPAASVLEIQNTVTSKNLRAASLWVDCASIISASGMLRWS